MKRTWAVTLLSIAVLILLSLTASAAPVETGYITADSPLVSVTVAGGKVTPIVSVGETVDGVKFEGLPDGIGLAPDEDGAADVTGRRGQRPGTVDVYVAHEQTTIPFRNSRDFIDASVTKWTLDTRTGRVLSAEVAISSDNGYLRFCSASVATPADGFDTHVFFANEETNDVVPVPVGAPYGADPATAPNRQGGYVVALDTATGDFTQIAGMGRHNHENTVAVPGYDDLVLLSGDDTFTATTSQLYMYLAANQTEMFADEGTLYAFRVTHKNGAPVVVTDPFNNANDYLDLGVDDEMQGEFIPVPEGVARGTSPTVAPQTDLETWSIANNVFTFVRLEDIAVDRNDSRVVYVADTGASRVVPNPATGRLHRPPGAGFADNGRIFKFVLGADNPLVVNSFTVFADGDAPPTHSKFVGFTSPDNIDTSEKSLMVQEDADFAQIWQHKFSNGTWRTVADVVDTGGESSGIVDASAYFGPGSWLLTVQAHDLPFVDVMVLGPITIKREEGQLVLLKIPGS